MNRLQNETREKILHALCEGMSQRSCARVFNVDLKTVVKLFRDAGDWAIAHVNSVEGLNVTRIEADELQSFVGHKRRYVGARDITKKSKTQ